MPKELIIPLKSKGEGFLLKLYASQDEDMLVDEIAEKKYYEAKWQLFEGKEYEYVLLCEDNHKKLYSFKKHELIFPSKSGDKSRGTIKTGNYVGYLTLQIVDQSENETEVNFEVRSKKVTYRSDYQTMLNDITSHFTDLVMKQSSPVTQRFEVNDDEDSNTLYQQFAFMKSLIDSEEFEEALNKIMYNPIRKWTGSTIEKDICSVKRLGSHELKQIASRKNRILLEDGQIIGDNIASIPQSILVSYKKDTTDVVENRFVKFVLLYFSAFCSNIRQLKNSGNRLKAEAELLEDKLACILNNNFFREISDLQIASFNSPALQRKEGYREVLQAWMMSKLAAQIIWEGGDNVYRAGKRNVAALYEYWVFFKLLDIVKTTFDLKQSDSDEKNLVKVDSDNINLDLRQGQMKMIGGISQKATRTLNVRLYYNRSFKKSHTIKDDGSWTDIMRPDYTLTIWPGNIKENEAEENDTIVHIHFDAKYRLDELNFVLKPNNASEENNDKEISDSDDMMNQEKEEEEKGIYKRADLLKMHAYKDAIRRTSGAYIIYPGSKEPDIFKGFHEIIPGLGAFCLNPKNAETDSLELKLFINDIVEHMLNRNSQREQIAYHTHETYKETPTEVREPMPEELIPSQITVLVGYYRGENHLQWILKNKIYNTRAGKKLNSLRLTNNIMGANYVLLYSNGAKAPQYLLKLSDDGPRMESKDDLKKKPHSDLYTPESSEYYVVFDIDEIIEENEFMNVTWNVNKMKMDISSNKEDNKNNKSDAKPIVVTLDTLMKYVIKK